MTTTTTQSQILAAYRRRYPGYMLVFRTHPAGNTVYLPDRPEVFTATLDEADEAILVAVQGGLRVLVVELVTQDAPLGGAR